DSSGLPVTGNAYQGSSGGSTDAFLARLTVAPLPPDLSPELDGGGLIAVAEGGEGGDPGADMVSESGGRYADGNLSLEEQDLASFGFGVPWGQTRLWSNKPGYAATGANGNGWSDLELPAVEVSGGRNTVAVVDGDSARTFDLVSGSYAERGY